MTTTASTASTASPTADTADTPAVARPTPAKPVSRAPRARPVAQPLALLLALGLVALAVVGVHDLAAARGWSAGRPWIPDVVGDLDGLTATTAVVTASVAAVVVGALLLLVALAPARRTHLRVRGDVDLWVSPAAVGALARATADRAPGVVSADVTRATRRRVVVEVVTQRAGEADAVADGVRSALAGSLADLTGTKIAVRTTELPR